jgi:hypothetical protein
LIPESIGGLPTHALIVHFAVVLIPLSVLVFAATGWRESLRKVYSLPVALLALVAVVSAFVATESGEALQDHIRDAARVAGSRANFGDHPEDGEMARNVAIVFAVVAIGFWAAVSYTERLRLPAWAASALYGLGCLVGLLAVVTVIDAGHSGATLVWKDLGNFVQPK